ncbi:MAG: MopE-related protein, partial [Myxococcota bacterium]|nr:MopE-related protein [Myxococcota bacterium]
MIGYPLKPLNPRHRNDQQRGRVGAARLARGCGSGLPCRVSTRFIFVTLVAMLSVGCSGESEIGTTPNQLDGASGQHSSSGPDLVAQAAGGSLTAQSGGAPTNDFGRPGGVGAVPVGGGHTDGTGGQAQLAAPGAGRRAEVGGGLTGGFGQQTDVGGTVSARSACLGEVDGTVVDEGQWSACAFVSVCDNTGLRQRVRTACRGGQAIQENETTPDGCGRDTDNTLLLEGTFGLCTYAEACATNGTKSRINRICLDGVEVERIDERAFAECERTTDGIQIEEGVYGECEYDAVCAREGYRSRANRVCLGGTISSEMERLFFPECDRDTDNVIVETGALGPCTYAERCTETGQRSQLNRICVAGEPVERIQSQPAEDCRRNTEGLVIQLGEPSPCHYESACSTTGTQVRTDQMCQRGVAVPVDVEEIAVACRRVTDDLVLRAGEYGECQYANQCGDEGRRSRTNRTCLGGVEVDVEETVSFPNCRRQQEGKVIAHGEFGGCAYETQCDEIGFKARANTVCRGGATAEEIERSVTPDCARETDGLETSIADVGPCIYPSPCAESGRRTRTAFVCIDGAEIETSETIMHADCQRVTEGQVVDPGTSGECQYAHECSETGTRTRTETICALGSERAQPVVEAAADCDRQTEGVVVQRGEFVGDCLYDDRCSTTGTQSQSQHVCIDGQSVPRQAQVVSDVCIRQPEIDIETCNDRDDDCDGSTDEAQPLGDRLVSPNDVCDTALGACRRDGIVICDPTGTGGVICEGPRGQVSAERCDDVDNDCDGRVDEDFAVGDGCSVGQGMCARDGVRVCRADELGTVCDRGPGEVTGELCNGLDDDCDGQTDELNPQGGGPCETNVPGRCQGGTFQCRLVDGTATLTCEQNQQPVAELCNGLDDDCDGNTDEGNPEGGLQCQDQTQVGQCRRGVTVCEADGLICRSQHTPQLESCNRADDDCDGRIDEVVGLGEMCANGVGACRRQGIMACDFPNGSDDDGSLACNAVPARPTAELCDGVDNNCDGMVDEGFQLGQLCT